MVLSIAAIVALIFQIDSRWVKPERAEAQDKRITTIEIRLNQKILQDRANYLQERMWRLEDRYGTIDKMPLEIRQEYRANKIEWEHIKLQLEMMGDKPEQTIK